MLFRAILLILLGITAMPAANAAEYKPKAIIGISGSSADSKSVTAMMVMVRTLGAEPVLLSNHEQRISLEGGVDAAIEHDSSMVDAVIVMGNNDDIDPAKYGQKPHEKTSIETDHARANYEEALLKKAINDKIPVLGVCGGHQRINVLLGGTLHQHVPDIVGDNHHMQASIPGFIPVQYVGITEGTKLGDIAEDIGGVYTPTHEELPDNVVMENSFHHQAIDKVGKGLRVNAVSNDNVFVNNAPYNGIIEGIEADPNGPYKDQFLMGVQWHPEFGASPLSPKLVQEVIDQAITYRKERPREQAYTPTKSFTETLTSSLNKIKEPVETGSDLVEPHDNFVDYINQQRSNQPANTGVAK